MKLNLPNLPNIQIDLDDHIKNYLSKFQEDNNTRIESARVEEGTLNILSIGYNEWGNEYVYHEANVDLANYQSKRTSVEKPIPGCLATIFSLGLVNFHPSIKEANKKISEHYRKHSDHIKKNTEEIENLVNHIEIYQGSIDEVEKNLGRKLEYIDTDKADKFIKGQSCIRIDGEKFWLRVAGYQLGAELLVNYNPQFSIATPVRFARVE